MPHDPTASAGSETPTPEVLARRRFVRGVFAAPAVMTVCSGSAFGADPMTSVTCLVKGQSAGEPQVKPFWTGIESPQYLRVRVWEQPGPPLVRFVSRVDLGTIGAKGVTSPVPNTEFIVLDDDGAMTNRVLDPKVGPVRETTSGVVVRIDSSGYVVGTGSPGTPGALTSMLCWDSVSKFF